MENIVTVDDEIRYNNYKLTADKILQLLSQIREDPSASAKRWVWELLQNAKDVPNIFGKVSVEIELISEDTLKFRHNGNTFSTKNITGLVQQVSSKDSQNLEGQTGKFGTGFICTHLLSDVIDVEGIVTYLGVNRKFKISLDRSGYRSEDLLPRIESTLETLRDIENKFDAVENYEENRTEHSFDTIFTYHLTTEEKQESAKAGLKDLINTLPITLVTQSNKIKQVRVINRLDNTDVTYTCESKSLSDHVQLSTIQIDEITKTYLSYITEDVALTTEIKINNDSYELIKRDSKQPSLYRDFPLIGSEKFYFPFTLNGFGFNPTERRNGLLLNSADHPSCIQNREIVDKAVDAALNFNEWLIQHQTTNRYLLAASRKPESPEPYSENVALPWINQLQSNWRSRLLDQNLVETDEGIEPLRNLSVPSFTPSATKEVNENFYDLLCGQYIGRGVLPKREYLHGWLEIVRPEYDTWGTKLKYDKDDFAKDLKDLGNMDALCTKTGKSKEEALAWLNKVYTFLVEQNLLNEFDNYAIIPNEKGDFKLLKELYSDQSKRIPSVLKGIYNSVNTPKNHIEHKLIDNGINATIFGNTVQTFSLKEMVTQLNKYISDGGSTIINEYCIDIKSTIAYQLIALHPASEDSSVNERRQAIYNFCTDYRTMDTYESLNTDELDLWKEADNYWFKNSYKKIVECGNVNKTSTEFFTNPKTENETIDWLNLYLKFYRDNSNGDLIKEQPVFPNQQLQFKKLSNLRFDENIPEEFKELANYAGNPISPVDVYRHQLLHRGIHGYEQQNPLSIKDIYEYVNSQFKAGNDTYKEIIARETISIIPKSENGNEPEKKLFDFEKTIFEDLFSDAKFVDTYTGFSWGFAQEHYINVLCERIAKSTNIEGFKTLSTHFSDKDNSYLISWIDALIDFLFTFKNKKYWKIITDTEKGFGIWLNQNNDFCKIQDVHKDLNINEELKDIAANNVHVNHDFRAELFSSESTSSQYLETEPYSLKTISEYIDEKIAQYSGDKQDKNFAALVFEIGKLCNSINSLSDLMKYYTANKNALIVGSLGEGDTLNLVGSIVQQGDDKLRIIKEILDNHSIEDLNKLAKKMSKQQQDNDQTSEEEPSETIQEEPISFNAITRNGTSLALNLTSDDSPYGGLSYEEMHAFLMEAKQMVREELEPQGYEFTQELCENAYSSIYGVMKDGQEIPLVVHSYLSHTRPFALNAFDWDQLKDSRSQLWVRTQRSMVQCVPFYALPKDNQTIAVTFRASNLEKTDRYVALAEVLRYFKGLQFNFGNTIPQCGNSPKYFNTPTKELKQALNMEDYNSEGKLINEDLHGDDPSLID